MGKVVAAIFATFVVTSLVSVFFGLFVTSKFNIITQGNSKGLVANKSGERRILFERL